MAKYYHGSNQLFTQFELDRAGEGTGVKFGYGIYLTSRYETAAHYSWPRKATSVEHNYVYTLEIPDPTAVNTLNLDPAVALSASLIQLVEDKLGETLPEEAIAEPKYLRKYVGNLMLWRQNTEQKKPTVKQMIGKASVASEKAGAAFFISIGLLYYQWPVDWKNPAKGHNIAVLEEKNIQINTIEEVQLDEKKHQLIEGTQKEIKL
jgi:hypothetical protein